MNKIRVLLLSVLAAAVSAYGCIGDSTPDSTTSVAQGAGHGHGGSGGSCAPSYGQCAAPFATGVSDNLAPCLDFMGRQTSNCGRPCYRCWIPPCDLQSCGSNNEEAFCTNDAAGTQFCSDAICAYCSFGG